MHSRETVVEALRLADGGLNNCEISRRTGVSRATVREWRTGKVPHSFKSKPLLYGRPTEPGACCPQCGAGKHRFDRLSTACDKLDLHWTTAPPKSVYVSRKADVARLDEFIGPKR